MLCFSSLMDAHSRRQAALDAIDAVLNGASGGDAESEIVDFKEEKGTIDHTGVRQSISAQNDQAAQALSEEAACMANGQHGGVLVVGVRDDVSGPQAFVGAHLDITWLRQRISQLTQPPLAVDEIELQTVENARIYLINVAHGLEEVRCNGKLRARFEDGCIELTGDRAREFLERRRRLDWSADPSGMTLSQATDDALASAREHYRAAHDRAAGGDLELARRLGLTIGEGEDPELNNAGGLLLCEFSPGFDQIDLLITVAEGTASRNRVTLRAPLLAAFDDVWEKLDAEFATEHEIVGAQRRRVRAIPESALREAVINAIAHRDHRLPRSSILALAIGDPATILKVTSPGGFPPGVPGDRILATRSHPRNPALANALRVLGLAEREGVGISTMFRVMLRDGHPPPEVVQVGAEVVCRLTGGPVDVTVRAFFDDLEATDPDLGNNFRAHIAVTALLNEPILRPEGLQELAQCTAGEAVEILEGLSRRGAVKRLLNRSRTYRLTEEARTALQGRINYGRRTTIEEQGDLVRAFLDSKPVISSSDGEALFGVKRARSSQILTELVRGGVIKPVGNARGRGVRYELADKPQS